MREDARSGELRFELVAATRELTRRHRWLRADCPRQWDAACWEERTERRTLGPEVVAAVDRAVAGLRTSATPVFPGPGQSAIQVVVNTADGRSRSAISTERQPDDGVLRLEALLSEAVRAR